MRRAIFTLGVVAFFIAIVAAWSKEDQEIFRLRDEVEAAEGPGVSFYEFVGVAPGANQEEINKAYRKRSKLLHPDKVKQKFIAEKTTGTPKTKGKKTAVKGSKGPSKSEISAAAKAASDRFARLGIVANILRGAGRERYDHFLSNGFPKWKGTGYYYARFRPGLGMVLTGLFIFVGGGGHWLALYLSWKRQQDFVGRYIRFARSAAWGDNLNVPGLDATGTATPTGASGDEADPSGQVLNRRQRRMQEKDQRKEKPDKKIKVKAAGAPPAATPASGITGPRKRVVAENGKILVVDQAGNVYLEQANEDGDTQQFLLDPNEMSAPTIKDTALVRLPLWAYDTVTSRFLTKKAITDEDSDFEAEDTPGSSSGADDFEVLEKVKTTAENGTGKAIRRKKGTSKQ